MERGFLDKVEDNAAVRIWSEMTQYEGRQAPVPGSYVILEPRLQLLHVRKSRPSAYNRRIYGFTSVFEDSSQQSLLESCKCTDLFEKNLKDVVLVHPDVKKRVDVFALSMYGLVIFPKALGHVDDTVTDLSDRLDKGVTPVSAILAETFRSLSACRRAGE
ncbi:hypothetical protein Gohar_019600, partial [Gossypium harknessii]|nr:hypothetical protein [Gossypium harknessii]